MHKIKFINHFYVNLSKLSHGQKSLENYDLVIQAKNFGQFFNMTCDNHVSENSQNPRVKPITKLKGTSGGGGGGEEEERVMQDH